LILVAAAAVLAGSLSFGARTVAAASGVCGPPAVNPVACENTLPGDPESDWQINGSGDQSIQGFATDMSVNAGGTVSFKISTPASSYHIDILRVGYYGGDGARKVASGLRPSAPLPQSQPNCLVDNTTGLVDCGNWGVSASWAIPAATVSGVYIAHLVRDDTGGSSHILFIVRNDSSHSNVFFQTSDATWQAYNRYGGNDFYVGGPAPPIFGSGRSYKVSYNRPVITRDCCEEDFFFHAEYPTIRFLEANGYDVSYTTDVDSDRNGPLIKNHKVFVTAGHDEYWSGPQRANVQSARDSGVSLAFFSGNNIYWKTRWEPSIDSGHTSYRTLVSYKETWANAAIDPQDPPTWTGTWRDPRFSPPADGGLPENALTGTLFTVNQGTLSLQVPSSYADLRLWRNTAVASLLPGQTLTLAPNSVGYEWNEDVDNGFRPPGEFDLSSTTGTVPQKLLDYGSTIGPGTATHHLTEYRAASGALVFSAGTIQWAWGLDNDHDATAPSDTDANMQQATVNLFADMGAQPTTLESGLVGAAQSTDTTPPTSTISAPATGATVQTNSAVTIGGTAVDSGGGVVSGVEVSTDGGTTWHPASGTSNWSYTWTPTVDGASKIRSRAVDDSGNLESPPPGIPVTVATTCPCSVWSDIATPDTPANADGAPVELGMRFETTAPGTVTGVRFYKGVGNGGTHTGALWTASGTQLALVTFTGETASGWQTATFASPVAINANTPYVISYHAPQGNYASSLEYFATGGASAGPVQALRDRVAGADGLYSYSAGEIFPTSSFESANYWVDVVFDPTPGPFVTSTSPSAAATGVATNASVSATFSAAMNAASLSFTLTQNGGGAVAASVTYSSPTQTAKLQPNSALQPGTQYTATVQANDTQGHAMQSPYAWSFTTAAPPTCPCTIFGATSPAVADAGDASAVELGVKFTSDLNGYITGVRFYKASGNTGTHVGNLWSATGTLLASGSFSGETASGWQTLTFSSPVAITAGTTYVASYLAPVGHYSATSGGLASNVDSPPLHALSSAGSGGDGVYHYGAASGFPSSSFNATNYWVDTVFTTALDTTPPVVTAQSPAANASGVAVTTTVSATFNKGLRSTSISFSLSGPGSTAVAGTSSYNAATNTVTFTPTSKLAFSTSYTASVTASDTNGDAMPAPATWSFTTAAPPTCPCTIFGATSPAVADAGDASAVELGVKFTSDLDGYITGVRFYKASGNTGTHVGNLWSATGTLLASGSFSGETASGWQTLTFSSPVAITAGTTYVASYLAPVGHYSATSGGLASNVDSPPLHALSSAGSGGDGVYHYGAASGFPSSSFNATNYWVDPVFTTTAPVVRGASRALGLAPKVAPKAKPGGPVAPKAAMVLLPFAVLMRRRPRIAL
jgi:Domain of unknown function (DUF4082)/Bacterial Ig-like domain/Bacterial Ig domain